MPFFLAIAMVGDVINNSLWLHGRRKSQVHLENLAKERCQMLVCCLGRLFAGMHQAHNLSPQHCSPFKDVLVSCVRGRGLCFVAMHGGEGREVCGRAWLRVPSYTTCFLTCQKLTGGWGNQPPRRAPRKEGWGWRRAGKTVNSQRLFSVKE